jgi:hypothetical protein
MLWHFEKKVLRRILVPKEGKQTRDWAKLDCEELYIKYYYFNEVTEGEFGGT